MHNTHECKPSEKVQRRKHESQSCYKTETIANKEDATQSRDYEKIQNETKQ